MKSPGYVLLAAALHELYQAGQLQKKLLCENILLAKYDLK